MPSKTHVPRTLSAAKKAGHAPSRSRVEMRLSSEGAKPGDIASIGPCENGNRIVCYFDEDMEPTHCVNMPC
jgi:hypothetical protein